MALTVQRWLLKQLNANNGLDAVRVTIKCAVGQFGKKRVARELRTLASYLENSGTVSGWNFPQQPGTVGKTSKATKGLALIARNNSHFAV